MESLTQVFWELVAKATFYFNDARPLLPMYTHLIFSALLPIYTGAHGSLSRPSSAAKPDKKSKRVLDGEDEEDEDEAPKMEGLSNSDAIVLPITAGITLATLYFLIKKYGAELINLVLGYYFAVVSAVSVARLLNDTMTIIVGLVFPTYFRYKASLRDSGCLMKVVSSERKVVREDGEGELVEASGLPVPNPFLKIQLPQWLRARIWAMRHVLKEKYTVEAYIRNIVDLSLNTTIINFFSALAGLGTVCYVNYVAKPWYLTNLQGFAVSYSAMQLLSPTTFATGSLILGSLFFYDIWAVFFTPLMVGVAKNLDQPIKMVFPRPDEPSVTPGEPPTKSFGMLGLGDIVVPGMMLGLALRFDLYMFYLKKQKMRTRRSTNTSAAENSPVQKATYVSPTGRWGDKFWTYGLPTELLPAQLKSSFPKIYFTAAMIGYVSGMITTLIVMSVFNHAQPALLYLVPGVLSSLWATALVRGEVKQMWQFSEAITAEQTEDDVNKKDETAKSSSSEARHKGLFERIWHDIRHGDNTNDSNKSDEKSKESKTSTSKATPNNVEKAGKKDGSKEGVLFSFSVSHAKPKRSSSSGRKKNQAQDETDKKKTHSRTRSKSSGSEDVVLVSSQDLEESKEADTASRYRTRNRSRKTSENE